MVNILFSDSACGSLKVAQHYGEGTYTGECISVFVSHSDGSKPTKKELESAKRETYENSRTAWENAIPMGGSPSDIFCFGLALSIGDISGNCVDVSRQRILKKMFRIYPNCETNQNIQEIVEKAAESLECVRRRIETGETVRIWYSNQPDEMCGLYWFMSKLNQWDINASNVVTVKLPESETDGNVVVKRNSWGEVAPGDWHRYLSLQKNSSKPIIRYYALRWQELQNENTPLRAIVNGKLVSVSEKFYDEFIYREIASENDEFQEAKVIGNILGKYQLGISDYWVAERIEELIKSDILEVTSSPSDGSPLYCRTLKKRIKMSAHSQ